MLSDAKARVESPRPGPFKGLLKDPLKADQVIWDPVLIRSYGALFRTGFRPLSSKVWSP